MIAYKNGIKLNNEPFTGNTAAFEIIPNFLLIQSWTNMTKSVSFNSPSWSISVEYYMYIIFGLILVYAFALRKIAWSGISIVSFALIYLNIPSIRI